MFLIERHTTRPSSIAGRLFESSLGRFCRKLPWLRGALGMSGPRTFSSSTCCFHPYPSDPLRLARLLASVQQRTSMPFHQTSNFKCEVQSKPRAPDIGSSDRLSEAACLSKASRADARMMKRLASSSLSSTTFGWGTTFPCFRQFAVDLHSLAKNSSCWRIPNLLLFGSARGQPRS